MRILVCGDRFWWDEKKMQEVFDDIVYDYENVTIIEGEAKGADLMARKLALECGLDVEGYPANWNKHKKAAGAIRNRKMLDQRIDKVIAFHSDIENSKGTKDCITEAKRRGIPVTLIT
jgi:hypothetical protein